MDNTERRWVLRTYYFFSPIKCSLNSPFVISPAKSLHMAPMELFEGDQNRTSATTFSQKEFEMPVNFCVKTQMEIPLCLPENTSSTRLPVHPFTSIKAAQSSRMKSVFVPSKKKLATLSQCSPSWSCGRSQKCGCPALHIHCRLCCGRAWGR